MNKKIIEGELEIQEKIHKKEHWGLNDLKFLRRALEVIDTREQWDSLVDSRSYSNTTWLEFVNTPVLYTPTKALVSLILMDIKRK